MKNEDEIRELCEAAVNECNTCNGDPEIDCIDCTQGGMARLAEQILELLLGNNQ